MPKLTRSYIETLPIPTKKPDGKPSQKIYRDSTLPGFGLLASSGGTKSFFVESRIHGRAKRISIGRYGHLTANQARKKAQQMLGEIALGHNPVAKKRASVPSITLEEAFWSYLRARRGLQPTTVINYKQCVYGCFQDWLSKNLLDITRKMVECRHRKIGQTAQGLANNAMRVLRAIYNHAIAKLEADHDKSPISNPVEHIGKLRAWYPEEQRRTLIKTHELAIWFQATFALYHHTARDYLHFLLFTGLRKTEAATLRWSDVDLTAKTMTVSKTKNRRPHELPLSTFLVDLLKRRKKYARSEWVFESRALKGQPIQGVQWSIDVVTELSGVSFTLHDIRRTFITMADMLDVPAYALKRLLNHKDAGDVTSSYIISTAHRLREPMQNIANFILEQFYVGDKCLLFLPEEENRLLYDYYKKRYGKRPDSKNNTARSSIPERPLQLLRAIVHKDMSLHAAAEEMGITTNTANKHISKVKRCLGVTTTAAAVYKAVGLGLV